MNSENPQLFVDYMKVKYPRLATRIPAHGRKVLVKKTFNGLRLIGVRE